MKKKVMSMYTDPNHIQVSDPGQIEAIRSLRIWMLSVRQMRLRSIFRITRIWMN